MYFDAKAITQLIQDPETTQKAAPAIAALRKRFTSPLAVVEAILVLGKGRDGAETEQQVLAFLDETGIEARDMPPANKLIAAAVNAEGGDTVAVLNAACAEYYEVEPFSLEKALIAAAEIAAAETEVEAEVEAAVEAATEAAEPAAQAVLETPVAAPAPAKSGKSGKSGA
jgi:uncharacterized protein with PIN domain